MNLGKTIRVFIDCEFTDFMNSDLISIGLAADNGDEFYGENSEFIRPWATDFVKKTVYPLLTPEKCAYRRIELSARVWSWIEELPAEFVIITADYKTDLELLVKLFDEDVHPKILEMQNIFNNIYYACDAHTTAMGGSSDDYDMLKTRVKSKYELYHMDYFFRTKELPHHALSDARANREAYTKIINEFGLPR
jgi:hypothetical protein